MQPAQESGTGQEPESTLVPRKVRRAIISLWDKTGAADLARNLVALGVQIISTGGTARLLSEAGIPVTPVSEITGFPEILGGRVKTLHPRIHGGILARRGNPSDLAELAAHGIETVDLVAVNLYPFAATIARPGVSLAEALENIDIGGPAMLRAAAKNFPSVLVLVDPNDYAEVLGYLRAGQAVPLAVRRRLAAKAFAHVSAYDALIARYLQQDSPAEGAPAAEVPASEAGEGQAPAGRVRAAELPARLCLELDKIQDLRYGENPHQIAAWYRPVGQPRMPEAPARLDQLEVLQGKELSYNNLNDLAATLGLLAEFSRPAAVAVKHATPCGVAEAITPDEPALPVLRRALEADPVSVFGGIVAVNRPVDRAMAEALTSLFLEVVAAPGFTEDALPVLQRKKNLRVLRMPADWAARVQSQPPGIEVRAAAGTYLVQTADAPEPSLDGAALLARGLWKLVTGPAPDAALWEDLVFGWKVVKHVRSNAIVVVRNQVTLGIDGGQVNRIDAARHALQRAGEAARGAVLASDAFFPRGDVVEAAVAAGIRAIIQPGGSIRDEESIQGAAAANLTMIFTGRRHFRH